MDLTAILSPQNILILSVTGGVTNLLVIGLVGLAIWKIAPVLEDIPKAIDTLKDAITLRLQALESKVSDIEHQLETRHNG